jgi:hypothetical protein
MPDVYNYITATGVIVPDTADILTEVQAEYVNAFGSDLNLDANTPQGTLITAETLARAAVADNNATLANQINPNEAGGIFLDALLALLGSERTVASPSTVLCTLTGIVGTSIPAGAQISDSNGDLYELVTTTVIPVGGSIANVPFQSVLTGAIPGNAGTLTTIVSNILGWETVTNPANATLGTSTQSDAQARLFRINTLASQGMGFAQAIISALTNNNLTPGVTSLTFQENATSSPATINDVPMVANSLYTCVAGTATPLAIAETLTNTKNGGCAYNNGLGVPQSVNVTNPFSGQVIPVLFDTPNFVTVAMTVTVHQFANVQDVPSAVKNSIIAYAAGQIPNEPGFVVGASVSPFQIAGAINILSPGLFVQEVQVGIFSYTLQGTTHNGTMTIDGLTYNTEITPGDGVSGAGIPPSTTVSSLSGSNAIIVSANSTADATEIITFTPTLTLQTTEIPLAVFQQAVLNPALITVVQV